MKKLVSVLAKHDTNGQIKPVMIYWDNGKPFEIDRITDIRPASSFRSGELGMSYTCYISGQRYYLYEEEGVWFIEKLYNRNHMKAIRDYEKLRKR